MTITVKDYFSQGFLLDKQINTNLDELHQLRQMATSISSPGFGEHYNATRNTSAPYTHHVEKIILLENTINAEIDKLVDLREQIRMTIKTVSKANERLVLQNRYLQHMTFEQIAKELGVDVRTIRRWHDSALQHVTMPKNPIIF